MPFRASCTAAPAPASTSYDVTIVTGEDPLGSSVAATIDLASIDTGNERRDHHLRSAGILKTGKHPTMSYRSTGIRPAGDGWVIDGALTLHGHTRQVPLAGGVNGFGPDPHGGHRAGHCATAQTCRQPANPSPTTRSSSAASPAAGSLRSGEWSTSSHS